MKEVRLIDAEKLGLTDFEIVMCDGDYKEALKMVLGKIENAPTVFSEADLIEIEDRFGYYVRAIIEDMISGENNRWSTKWCEETLDIKRN